MSELSQGLRRDNLQHDEARIMREDTQLVKDAPILHNTRAICKTKLNSARPDISLVPCAACSVFERSCENSNARLGSS